MLGSLEAPGILCTGKMRVTDNPATPNRFSVKIAKIESKRKSMPDRKANVLYVGDNIETISIMHVGYDLVFNNHSVTEERLDVALRSDPEISVDRIWGTAVDRKFPNT